MERQQGHGRVESRSIKVIDLDGAPEAGLFPQGPEPSRSSVGVVVPVEGTGRWRRSTR
jgi:hypothetical protein